MFDMLQLYLLFALVLYIMGIYTLASNRNMVKLVIGIEILVAAVNLNFLAFAAFITGPSALGPIDPMVQKFVILSICVGGAIAVLLPMCVSPITTRIVLAAISLLCVLRLCYPTFCFCSILVTAFLIAASSAVMSIGCSTGGGSGMVSTIPANFFRLSLIPVCSLKP